jgi:hypothetical protein
MAELAWSRAAAFRLPEHEWFRPAISRGPARSGSREPLSPLRRHRAIFISDVHLGTRGCKAELLADFLTQNSCETLFLVGDILDGWRLRRRWYWPDSHNRVVEALLHKIDAGTRVTAAAFWSLMATVSMPSSPMPNGSPVSETQPTRWRFISTRSVIGFGGRSVFATGRCPPV